MFIKDSPVKMNLLLRLVIILTFVIPIIADIKSSNLTSSYEQVPKLIQLHIPKINQKHSKRLRLWASTKVLNSAEEQGQLDFFGRKWLTDLVHGSIVQSNKFSFEFINKFKAIFPGTNFCGDGDKGENIMDLGYFRAEDICCRDHDFCQDVIVVDETRHGLHNTGLFSRLNCECDRKLYECFRKVNSFLANKIGFTYFTVLGPQCFQNDNPIIGCTKYSWGRCTKYQLDKSKPKRYQWFDNPTFFFFSDAPYTKKGLQIGTNALNTSYLNNHNNVGIPKGSGELIVKNPTKAFAAFYNKSKMIIAISQLLFIYLY